MTPKSSESPFAEVSGGKLEIEGLVLQLDRERLEEFVRTQYMVPAPKGKDYDWHRVLLNLMSRGRPSEGEDKAEWKLPEEAVLLVLFASKDLENDSREVTEEGSDKIEGTDEAGEGEVGEKVEDSETSEKEETRGNNSALLYGLLIAPTGDGTHERIAAVTDLLIGGEWNSPANRSRVTII